MIREFWRKLTENVHPDDALIFASSSKHTFNLEFPPPAFVGNPELAPIVILMANGGYKRGITEAEFPDEETKDEFRRYLWGDMQSVPKMLSAYYSNGTIGKWLHNGTAVLVNAVAYRSPQLSEEPHNKSLADKLQSVQFQREWVKQQVIPDARDGRRFLVIHRNGMWKLDKVYAGPSIIFSKNPQSPYLANDVVEKADEWLKSHG